MKKFLTSKWTRLAGLGLAAVMLAVLVMGVASAPVFAQSGSPATGTPQAGSANPTRTAALEKAFAKENTWLTTQASNLEKIGTWVTRAQNLIDKAKAKGWDLDGLQAALNAFKAQMTNAQELHHTANLILTKHAGFDDNGKVSNAAAAVQTVKDARQSLADARGVMRQAVLDLRSVIRNFRDAHKDSGQPAAPTAAPSGSGS